MWVGAVPTPLTISAHGRPEVRSDFFPAASRFLNFSASNALGSVVLQLPNGAGELVDVAPCANTGCGQPAQAIITSRPRNPKTQLWPIFMLSCAFYTIGGNSPRYCLIENSSADDAP